MYECCGTRAMRNSQAFLMPWEAPARLVRCDQFSRILDPAEAFVDDGASVLPTF